MIEKHKTIPNPSLLKKDEKTFDYIDNFKGYVSTNPPDLNIQKVGNLFLTSGPGWADALMKIRDKTVGLFGLKTSSQIMETANVSASFEFKPGQRTGMFKCYEKTDNELILGEDDKHLCFRVSLLLENHNPGQQISITTMVKYQNWLGRLYFLPVKPVHQRIVRATLKEMIQKL